MSEHTFQHKREIKSGSISGSAYRQRLDLLRLREVLDVVRVELSTNGLYAVLIGEP